MEAAERNLAVGRMAVTADGASERSLGGQWNPRSTLLIAGGTSASGPVAEVSVERTQAASLALLVRRVRAEAERRAQAGEGVAL